MKTNYYYVACEAREKQCNDEYRHYFRLYKDDGGKSILVDQGLSAKIEGWEAEYNATLSTSNPYPNLD